LRKKQAWNDPAQPGCVMFSLVNSWTYHPSSRTMAAIHERQHRDCEISLDTAIKQEGTVKQYQINFKT
jgi:hypothetical protein